MSPLAHTALAASIVLSALGAVIICLLTAMFGFTPPSEEPPAQATRRLFLTRVGHAVAAACFAGTAILLAVVLGQPARTTSPAGGDARVLGLASKLDAHMERLEGVERRMKESEHTLERLEAEISDATAQRLAPEPSPAVTTKAVERPRAAAAPAKPAERPTVTVTPPHKSTVTVTPPAVAAESPKDAEQPAASPAPAPSPSPAPRASPPAPAPRSSREVVPPPPADFRAKLRDDWRAIRRGWESAGDDFKSAIDRLRRPD
jgi:hypothetical protein